MEEEDIGEGDAQEDDKAKDTTKQEKNQDFDEDLLANSLSIRIILYVVGTL